MQFSPGVLQGGLALLDILSRRALTMPQLQLAFPSLGGMPAAQVIEAGFYLRWMSVNPEGMAAATPVGERIRLVEGYEQRLRQAILDYIDAASPPWVQTASFGRKRLLSFAGNQIGQVFLEAGLVDGTDEAVVAFWDDLASRARGQRDDRLNAIGRQGERLSMEYERQRTGRMPKWVAIDNNADGYDILSVVSAADVRQCSIEVKTSTSGLHGIAHLTRNEWDRALDAPEHVFHLWCINSSTPSLAVVGVTEVAPHIPPDAGSGRWVAVEVPFDSFAENFSGVNNVIGKCYDEQAK